MTRIWSARWLPRPHGDTVAALSRVFKSPALWKGQWWARSPSRSPGRQVVEHGGTKLALETLRAALGDANSGRAPRRRRQRRRHEGRAGRGVAARAVPKEADVEVKKSILRSLGAIKDNNAEELVASRSKQPSC